MALMCAWRRAGIVPTSATFATEGDVSVTYPNGLVLSRWTMQLVRGALRSAAAPALSALLSHHQPRLQPG